MKIFVLSILSFWQLLPIALVVEVLAVDDDYITCGSTVKLLNQAFKVRLHSHDVKYGTG